MSKRLLSEETALRKIELSLKLQGKTFKPDFIGCQHCKFCWGNRNDQPRWVRKYRYPWDQKPGDPPENPKPEKYGWNCALYKNTPYHAYLRFKVVRYNAEGVQIPRKPWYDEKAGHWTYSPTNGEYDKMVLVSSGSNWRYSICKRFEACPPR